MKKLQFVLESCDFSFFSKENQWLCGSDAVVGSVVGIGKMGSSKEESARKMVEYFDENLKGQNSLVREALENIGWDESLDEVKIDQKRLKKILIGKIIYNFNDYDNLYYLKKGRMIDLQNRSDSTLFYILSNAGYSKYDLEGIDRIQKINLIKDLESEKSFDYLESPDYKKKLCQIAKCAELEELDLSELKRRSSLDSTF